MGLASFTEDAHTLTERQRIAEDSSAKRAKMEAPDLRVSSMVRRERRVRAMQRRRSLRGVSFDEGLLQPVNSAEIELYRARVHCDGARLLRFGEQSLEHPLDEKPPGLRNCHR
jgi:hypothetical protein